MAGSRIGVREYLQETCFFLHEIYCFPSNQCEGYAAKQKSWAMPAEMAIPTDIWYPCDPVCAPTYIRAAVPTSRNDVVSVVSCTAWGLEIESSYWKCYWMLPGLLVRCLLVFGGFHKWGSQKWMVYNGKYHLNGWFGVPLFPETPSCWFRLLVVVASGLPGILVDEPSKLSRGRTFSSYLQLKADMIKLFQFLGLEYWVTRRSRAHWAPPFTGLRSALVSSSHQALLAGKIVYVDDFRDKVSMCFGDFLWFFSNYAPPCIGDFSTKPSIYFTYFLACHLWGHCCGKSISRSSGIFRLCFSSSLDSMMLLAPITICFLQGHLSMVVQSSVENLHLYMIKFTADVLIQILTDSWTAPHWSTV